MKTCNCVTVSLANISVRARAPLVVVVFVVFVGEHFYRIDKQSHRAHSRWKISAAAIVVVVVARSQ